MELCLLGTSTNSSLTKDEYCIYWSMLYGLCLFWGVIWINRAWFCADSLGIGGADLWARL